MVGSAGEILTAGVTFLVGVELTGIGILVSVPSLLGFSLYKIYKYFKSNECKKFYEELQNQNKMKEEREIYKQGLLKINSYYDKFFKSTKKEFTPVFKEIMGNILSIYLELDCINLSNEVENYKKKYENISKFNIMVIGRSGVGKSTLINGVLKLKEGKGNAIENSKEAQKIEGWTRKYPISNEDTDIKGLNLWDTEGIEITDENNNDIIQHKNKVISHIREHSEIPNQQINCLWYCINGNRLENGEKKYIESMLEIYDIKTQGYSMLENYKFPIIFIYTQAYESSADKVEEMENCLKELNYYKSHNDDFHFIDVVAKEKQYKGRRNENKIERKYNIKELVKKSFDLGSKGLALPLVSKSNEIFFNLYKNNKNLLKNLAELSQELMKKILGSEKLKLKDIFDEAIPEFKKIIKSFGPQNIDNENEKKIDENIDKIIDIMKKMLEIKVNESYTFFDSIIFIISFYSLISNK